MSAMQILLTTVGVLLFVLCILFSIALHEIGHLVPAKRSGVKVTQYMIGFGPTIWSRRRGDTEYGIKGIPLGGYIRMIGMFPPAPDGKVRASSTGPFQQLIEDARSASAEEIQPGDENRVFYKLPVWRKIMIMLGGPFMNLVLAFVFFAIAFSAVGRLDYAPQVGALSKCVVPAAEADRECLPTDPRPPAFGVLSPGQRILAINGEPVEVWSQFTERVREHGGRQITITVESPEGRRDVAITPMLTPRPVAGGREQVVGFLGVEPSGQEVLYREPLTALPGILWDYSERVFRLMMRLPERVFDVWQAVIGTEDRDREGLIGVVGVSRLGGEILADNELPPISKAGLYISLLGGLNLALFVFNLLPLLPLDGGHVAGALYEGARRQVARLFRRPDPGPFDVAKLLPVMYVVAVLLGSMSILLMYADIVVPIRLRG